MERISLGVHRAEKKESYKDGNIWRSRKIADLTGHVVVDIDPAKLVAYAKKTLLNKRHTSRALNGAVIFRVVGNVTQHPIAE